RLKTKRRKEQGAGSKGVKSNGTQLLLMAFNLQFVETPFFIQNPFRFVEDGLRLLGRVTHCCHAQSSGACERAEHMENDSRLADLSEVQAAPNGEIEKIVR